ncbi:hypothetical protein Hanom_Chr17g01537551 [Helianthus anomalus]
MLSLSYYFQLAQNFNPPTNMDSEKQQPLLSSGDTYYTNLKQFPLTLNGDVEIKGVGDFCREFYVEFKRLWYLAGPVIFTSFCQYTIGATTQLFAGQLGTIQLAATSVEIPSLPVSLTPSWYVCIHIFAFCIFFFKKDPYFTTQVP